MASEWISVEERLPPIGKYVLIVAFRGTVVITAHCTTVKNSASHAVGSYQWRASGQTMIPKSAVTHWMPLPAPPEPRP